MNIGIFLAAELAGVLTTISLLISLFPYCGTLDLASQVREGD